ncbi:MAG: glycosyl hydrolase [Acidimicrobiales bacterium]|nr:glycosyl hydrolase [Acidimicrobiales bacterium]
MSPRPRFVRRFPRRRGAFRPIVAVALAATVAVGPAAPGGAAPVEVDVVTSTADGSVRVEAATLSVEPVDTGVPTVDVHLDQPRQRRHGVGASLTDASAHLIAGLPAAERTALIESLFAPDQGGQSVLRIVIGASDFSRVHASLADSPTPDPDLATFSIAHDRTEIIPVLREILAVNPDVEIVASPWSAPAWMKDTDNYLLGTLLEQYEDVFARYLVRFVEAYAAEGVDVDWLTLQNEPAAVQITYPSMLMSAEQQARIIRDDLGPALAASGLPTRVLTWDHNWCDAVPPGGCASDAPASFPFDVLEALGESYPLAGTALHCYGGDHVATNEAIHAAAPDLQIWHTECSGGDWNGTREAAFGSLVRFSLNELNHWSNASIFWNLALDPDHGPHLGGCDTCRGVVTIDPVTGTWVNEVEFDVLAITSRFGPQGSGVLATTNTASSLVSAGVCSPDRRPAAILFNDAAEREVTVRFGSVEVPVTLAASSYTAVRAPEGVTCELAAWAELPPAPERPVDPTPEPPALPPTPPATPIRTDADFTG